MRQALELALEALEDRTSLMKWQIARDAVKEALAQHDSVQAKPEPEQEPVKYSDYESDGVDHNKPPQRTWVGLTDDEKFEICMHSIQNMGANFQETLCKAIETELKQKNGYAEEKNT